jgi:hypothetical protein
MTESAYPAVGQELNLDPKQSRRSTVAGVCGILFLPVFVVGAIMALSSPDSKDSDTKWRDWYADSGHRTQMLIGAYLLIVSALLFLAFTAGLRERLSVSLAPASAARWFLAATAIAFAALVMVGAIQTVGIAGNISFGDTPVPKDADLLRNNFGFPFIFVAGALSAAAFIATAGVIGRSVGLFPSWLKWLSFVAAVILIFAVIFLPMAALPIWVLIVSIILLRAPAAGARARAVV